jgi:hypothetical protein
MRVPFTVADLSALTLLTLSLRYEDGFVAYLNGTEVPRRNAPATLPCDSSAAGAHQTGILAETSKARRPITPSVAMASSRHVVRTEPTAQRLPLSVDQV